MVDRCGGALGAESAAIRDALLPFLDDTRQQVRKRALTCLGESGAGALTESCVAMSSNHFMDPVKGAVH